MTLHVSRFSCAACAFALIAVSCLFLSCGNACAQSPYNQPQVTIVENTFAYTIIPNGYYNITLYGYMNVTNPSTLNSLFNVNITYAVPPAPYLITQTGAQFFAGGTGPFPAASANMLNPGVVHINEIAPGHTYQVLYKINATLAWSNTTYNGFTQVLNGSESVFLNRTTLPGAHWVPVNLTYNSTYGWYENDENRLTANDSLSFVVRINNTGFGDLANMRLQKQLPKENNASTGNATFTVDNVSYWSTNPSEVNYQTGFVPDSYNVLTMPVTGGPLNYISPGNTMTFQINGTVTNVAGNIPPGGTNAYVNFNPAYFTFTTTDTQHSYLGSLIDNRSYSWFTSGGDASFDLAKTFNPDLGKWRYRILVYNPTDITFNLTNINVYRNIPGQTVDYQLAVSLGAIYSATPCYTLDPGSSYDTGLLTDTGYNGGADAPPVYWESIALTVNGTAVGSPGDYRQTIALAGSNPGNVTVIEPAWEISTWRLYVTKNATYSPALGAYVINITATNTGQTATPGNIRVFDFIPQLFNATSFFKNGTVYLPDYNGAPIVNGPKTIGWNLGAISPMQSQTMSYYAYGNASEYYSIGLYVIGADPLNVEGAIPGGDGQMTVSVGGLPVGIIAVNVIALVVLFGVLRRFK